METSILHDIFSNSGLTLSELETIGEALREIRLKKGQTLINSGDTVLDTHFVSSGCLRTYFIDDAGKDHTLQFAIKGWWISDYTALFTGDEALMNIECIEAATIYKLRRKKMEELYEAIPPLETYFRKKLERRFIAHQRRTLGYLAQTAKERYLSFVQTYPNIEMKVKNYHIASYLGITAESLSRIRKELAR